MSLYIRDEDFFLLLSTAIFSNNLGSDHLLKQKIIEISKTDIQYAREITAVFLECPVMTNGTDYLFLQNMTCSELMMLKTAVKWLNIAVQAPSTKPFALIFFKTLALFSLKNPALARYMLSVSITEITPMCEFLNQFTDQTQIQLQHLQDFLAFKKSQGIEIVIDFDTHEITSQRVYRSVVNFLNLHPDAASPFLAWLNTVLFDVPQPLIQTLPLYAKIQHLSKDHLLIAFQISNISSLHLETLEFATRNLYVHRTLKMLECITLVPQEGKYLLTLTSTHPHLTTCLFNLFDKINNKDTLSSILTKSRSIDINLFERLLKIDAIPADLLIDAFGWVYISPAFVDKWLHLAERGLILPISQIPPSLVDRLIQDGVFFKTCRYLNTNIFTNDFWNLYHKNAETACRLLNIAGPYPSVFIAVTRAYARLEKDEYSSVYERLISLNIHDPQHVRIMNALLFLLEGEFVFERKKSPQMFEHLMTLADSGEFNLLESLLDMAKVVEPLDIIALFERRAAVSDEDRSLIQLCINKAGSEYGKTIGAILRLSTDSDLSKRLIRLLSDENKSQGNLKIADYLFNSPTDDQIIKILNILENYSSGATPRSKTIYTALYDGDFAFVEFVIDRPAACWDDQPKQLQESLWSLVDIFGEGHPVLNFCLDALKEGISGRIIHEFAALVLLFEAQKNTKFKNIKPSSRLDQAHAKMLQIFNNEINSFLQLTGGNTADSNPLLEESLEEMAISKKLAGYLLTSRGRINKGMVSLIKNNAAFKLKTSKLNDYGKYLNTALRSIETDTLGISGLLSTLKAPADPNTSSYKLLATMTEPGKEINDRAAQEAVLSALLTRLRQHEARGTCFGTGIAIGSLSTHAGFFRAAKEFCDLIQYGTLSIPKPYSDTGYIHEVTFEDYAVDANPLARAREYTIVQSSSTLQLSRTTLSLLKYQKKSIFAERLYLICQQLNAHHFCESILAEMTTCFSSLIEDVYLPDADHPSIYIRGAWCLEWIETRQKITSFTEYLQIIIEISKQAKTKMTMQFQMEADTIKTIFDKFEEDLLNNPQIILKGISIFYQDILGIKTNLSEEQKPLKAPWMSFLGGDPFKARKAYYQGRSGAWVIKKNNTPEECLLNLLMYGMAVPRRIKREIQENNHPLIFAAMANHVCNIDTASIVNALNDEHPITLIENLKKDALQIRSQEIPEETILEIKNKVSSLLSINEAPLFLRSLNDNREVKTIAQLSDLILTKAGEFFNSSETVHEFCVHSENILRSSLANIGYDRPRVIPVFDTNNRAEKHYNQTLGYGISALTLEVLEFTIYSHQREPIINTKKVSPCKELRLNHCFN